MLGGELNPILGFCFPLFSMVFPGEFPSAQKTADSCERKSVANCCKSTYKFFLRFSHFVPVSACGYRSIMGFGVGELIYLGVRASRAGAGQTLVAPSAINSPALVAGLGTLNLAVPCRSTETISQITSLAF